MFNIVMNKIFAYVVLHIIQSETMCSSKTQNKKLKESLCHLQSNQFVLEVLLPTFILLKLF